MVDISQLGNKINNSDSARGKWTAEEHNTLIEAVQECQGSVKKINYGGADFTPNDAGLVTLPVLSDEWIGTFAIDYMKIVDSQEVWSAINSGGGQQILYATSSEVQLRFLFREFMNQVIDGEQTSTPSNKEVTITIKKKSGDSYRSMRTMKYIAQGASATTKTDLSINSFLTGGTNEFIVEVSGTSSGRPSSIAFTILVAELSISAAVENDWLISPIILGDSTQFTAKYVAAGAITRLLHMKLTLPGGSEITAQDVSVSDIGNEIIATSIIPSLQNINSGIGTVEAWLTTTTEDNQTVESNHVQNNVLFTTATDTNPYILVHNIADEILNYEATNLFDYAIYQSGENNADVIFTLRYNYDNNTTREFTIVEQDKQQGRLHTLRQSLALTSQYRTLSVTVYATVDGVQANNGSALVLLTVINSSEYAATEGASLDIDPSNYDNTINGGKIYNNATGQEITGCIFNNMTWDGTNGYMTDSDGQRFIRVLAGSSMKIPYDTYSEFNNNAYHNLAVEIDFAVRNITNESDPVLVIGNPTTRRGVIMTALEGMFVTTEKGNDQWVAYSVGWMESKRTHVVFEYQYQYRLVNPDTTRNSTPSTNINIVRGYVGSIINSEYKFDDASDGSVIKPTGDTGYIEIGQQGCDIDIYRIRIYKSALGPRNVEKNYRASKPTISQKAANYSANDILGNDGLISYDKCLAKKYNCIVRYGAPINFSTRAIKYTYGCLRIDKFNNGEQDAVHSGWLYGTQDSGQGTTAKTYGEWNIQTKADKDKKGVNKGGIYWSEAEQAPTTDSTGVTKFVPDEGSPSSFGFALDDGDPKAKKLVGKINYASSMQSHKMGACNAYNDLYAQCVNGSTTNFNAGQRVTVKELPFLYFTSPNLDTTPTFQGLMTWGPGKADKPTWGIDDPDLQAGRSMIEGAYNNKPLTDMLVPFTDDGNIRYNEDKEAFCYQDDREENLDFGFGDTCDMYQGNEESKLWRNSNNELLVDLLYDITSDATRANEKFEVPTQAQVKMWQPIYNFLYLTKGNIASWSGTPADLNTAAASDSSTVDKKTAYWMENATAGVCARFDLYRWDYIGNSFVPAGIRLISGVDNRYFDNLDALYDTRDTSAEDFGVESYHTDDIWTERDTNNAYLTFNLYSELIDFKNKYNKSYTINSNSTTDNINTAFKYALAQVARHYIDSNIYLHRDSVLFHYDFMTIFCGSDNGGKNTYQVLCPYTTIGSRDYLCMEMHQDDLDTIKLTNNKGLPTKPYYALIDDLDTGGKPYWEDVSNQLVKTIRSAYGIGSTDEKLQEMLLSMFNAMETIAHGKTRIDGTLLPSSPKGFDELYFSYIQEYFPAVAYNETARIRYEVNAVFYKGTGDGQENTAEDPFLQQKGDQKDREIEWMRKRLTMLYGLAGYAEGEMGKRYMEGTFNPVLVPHQYVFPMYGFGGSANITMYKMNRRIASGVSYNGMIFNQSNDSFFTFLYFINSMREIGNMGGWTNGGSQGGDASLSINGPRLVKLESWGATTDAVKFKITNYDIGSCVNVEQIDMHNNSNVSALTGLQNLLRLKYLDLRGTAITSLNIPQTPTLLSMRLPAMSAVTINNCPNLATLQFDGYDSLTSFVIKGESVLSTKEILMGIYGYNITQDANVIQTIEIENINWTSVHWTLLDWLLTVPNLRLTGRIAMAAGTSGQISFALKKRLIEKFGNTTLVTIDGTPYDQFANGLLLSYTRHTLGSVIISGDGYFDAEGEVKHYDLIPNVITGNTIASYQWTLTGTNANMGSVDTLGNVTCLAMGSTVAAPTATLTCVVTLADGTTLPPATMDIRFYFRQAMVGDFVYHDGTWDNRYNASKEVIGICFMCEPITDEEGTVTGYDRRMVALKDIGNYNWGLDPTRTDNNSSTGFASTGSNALRYLLNGVSTDPFDVPDDILPNITTSGGQVLSTDTDISSESYNVGSNYPYVRFGSMIDPNTGDFYKYSNSVAFGRMNLVELGSTLADGVFSGDAVYNGSSVVPRGLHDTAAIILHRNRVLAGTTYEGDEGIEDDVNYGVEFRLDPDIDASTGNVAQQINKITTFAANTIESSYPSIYTQYLYPAASMAYAYEPKKSDESDIPGLLPKFKKHHWYLPSIGELARLYYFAAICYSEDSHYVSQANHNPYGDIFANALSMLGSSKFARLSTTSAYKSYWSSSEYYSNTAWSVDFTSGYVHYYAGYGKCDSLRVRACAAF